MHKQRRRRRSRKKKKKTKNNSIHQKLKAEIMPEARDRILRDGSGETYGDSGQVFMIGRGGFFNAPGLRNGGDGLNRSGFWSDNKENIPPGSSTIARRRVVKRNSPLPSWYPRSPLRDITAVVNAMERRRARHRTASQLGRRNQETEDSSPSPLQPNPLTPEPSVSEPTSSPIQSPPPPAISETSPNLTFTFESSPMPKISSLNCEAATTKFFEFPADPTIAIEDSKLPCPHPIMKSSPIDELPSDSPAKIENTVIMDRIEKKLSEAINEIERAAKARIKSMPAEKKKKKMTARRTVMSMR